MTNDIQISFENSLCKGSDMDDDWDPMREEYENPFINTYDHGPGANLDAKLQRPAYRDRNNQVVYKIMVNRIPRGMTRVGLENLFMNFGTPNVSKFQENAFAVIEFKTLREAQQAIMTLDSTPPHNLDVKFSKSDEELKRLHDKTKKDAELYYQMTAQQSHNVSSAIEPSTPNPGTSRKLVSLARMIGRGQNRGKLILNSLRDHSERQPGRTPLGWSNCTPDFVNPGVVYCPKSYRYETTNRVLKNMVITSGIDSIRRVCMGRGYVPPAPKSSTSSTNNSEALQTKTIGEDICIPLIPCTKCGSQTSLKCSKCGTPYCSRQCQRDDFIVHKPHCSLKDFDTTAIQQQESLKVVPLSESGPPVQSSSTLIPKINRFWGRPDKNVLSLLNKESEARLSVQFVEPGKFHGQLSCPEVLEVAHKLFMLPSELSQVSSPPQFWPSVGSLVAVRHQGSIWRGYILSSPSVGSMAEYTVALCDLGQVQKIKPANVLPLPSNYHDLPELAVTCTMLKSDSGLITVGDQVKEVPLKVENISADKISAHVVADNKTSILAEVELSPWVPSCPFELTPVLMVPPCNVTMSAYHHQHAIFVQPTGQHYQEQLFNVMQKVAAVHVTDPHLGRVPYKGEMVACRYKKDGNSYRALVYGEASNGEYSVFFVDFGNTDSASVDDMKALPEELKSIPCMAVKVSLKGVKLGPLTEGAVHFLNMVIQKNLQLKLECPNNSSQGVVLTLPDNSSFNSQINDLLMPDWEHSVKKGLEPYKGEVFMLDRFTILPLIKGGLKSGFTNIVVSNILDTDGRVAVCPLDCPDDVEHVLQTLAFQINEFCEALDEDLSYNPRINEVCLAKYKDGMWYRAVNIRTDTDSQSSCVLFLDYGNIENVKFKEIRRMAPDFVSSPTIISLCEVDGVPLPPTEESVKRVKELISVNKVYEIEVLDMPSAGEYKISIPEISNQLKSEFSS